MQFFRRNRSPASLGGYESASAAPPADPYHSNNLHHDNHPHFRNHNQSIFSVDPFHRNTTDHTQPHPSVASSPTRDDDEPVEGVDDIHPAYRAVANNKRSTELPQFDAVAPTDLTPVHNEASGFYRHNRNRSSAEDLWPSFPRSSSRPDSDRQSKKLQKKKNIFSLHSSSASSGTRSNPTLGRSFSVTQNSSPVIQQRQEQQIVDRRRPSEPFLGFRLGHGEGKLQIDPLIQQSADNSNFNFNSNSNSNPQPTKNFSRNQYSHSSRRVNTDPLDGHHDPRAENGDPFPSQVSSQSAEMLPYRGEIQPPSPLHPSFQRDPYPSHHPAHQLSNPPDPGLLPRRSPQPESNYFPARSSSLQSLEPSPFPQLQSHSSDLMNQQTSSRRPSDQTSHVNTHLGDMAGTDRSAGLNTSNQPSLLRRDSSAVTGHSPFPPGTPQASTFKLNVSQQNLHEPQQGRETPPSAQNSKSRDELDEVDIAALIQKHEELQAKYTKVKRYYFEKEAQVQQLQNTVAHQRMAVSRTVLDDNEYTSRFNRLDGAIKDLAFSIRKEWKAVPNWLQPYVTEDAVSKGGKEMTTVGRAVISRWLLDEVFNRHFHPNLEVKLSLQLKEIETSLRRHQVQVFTDEDKENQVARISNWRRTTLDGLQEMLQAPSAEDHRAQLTDSLIEKFTASLGMDLKDPPPPEIEQVARMIVENALGIAEKIPLEARDICVEYFMPGTPVAEATMKVESGLPALSPEQRSSAERASADRERSSLEDVDMDRDAAKESGSAANVTGSPSSDPGGQQNLPSNRDQRKKYVFGNFMSKKPGSGNSPGSQQESARPGSGLAKDRDESEKQEGRVTRIRFAAFMAIDVRGKGPNTVLIKAPVYVVDA